MSAEIRPRSAWEAVDLGWVLARQHYGAVLRAWLVTVVPLWAVILAVLHEHPFWAMMVIWWWKPIYEKVPLLVLSRELFGERLGVGAVLRAWPRMLGRRVLGTLVGGRLSPARHVMAPIVELEGLRGRELRQRKRAIAEGVGGTAFWQQIALLIILHTSWIGIVIVSIWMIPARYQPNLEVVWAERNDLSTVESLAVVWGWIALYLTCLTLVTPFIVGGGFGLYLNARTRLEGWDVELAFRRMRNRLQHSLPTRVAVLLAGCGLLACLDEGRAEERRPPEVMEEVLADPDFEIHKAKMYRWNETEEKEDGSFSLPQLDLPLLGGLGQVVSWIILGCLGAFVLYLILRALVSSGGPVPSRVGPKRPPVKTVMGLNVEETKLPRDVVAAARELWRRGDHEAATKLLYRGAISWLVTRGGVSILESDTEVDCVRRVERERRGQADYFAQLTRVWVMTAYGGGKGTEAEMTDLFERWPFRSSREGGAS